MLLEEDIKYKILIVEDSLLNQYVLKNILQDKYIIETAVTAHEATILISYFNPDLILLDIILPDANGFEVLKLLKSKEAMKNIPVIIITGMGSEENEELGLMLGAVDYIKKPFKHGVVSARINTQIRIIKQMHTIELLSMLDCLTDISNRRAFDLHLQSEWNRAISEEAPISMVMLDIDNFKKYNDTYGHPQGDLILQSIAKVLKFETKDYPGCVFRYGGEEFSIILTTGNFFTAIQVSERIRNSVENTKVRCFFSDILTHVTISAGVASIKPDSSVQMRCLVEMADQKLYEAKRNGGNCVRY